MRGFRRSEVRRDRFPKLGRREGCFVVALPLGILLLLGALTAWRAVSMLRDVLPEGGW